MSRRMVTWSAAALGVLAATALAIGIGVRPADAQAQAVSAGGPYQAVAGQTIEFAGSSYAASLAAASWTFSDGASLAGVTVYRAFGTPGTYSATFNAVDIYGATYSATTTVTVYASATVTSLTYPTLVSGFSSVLPATGALLALNPSLASLYAQFGIALPVQHVCTAVGSTADWPGAVVQGVVCPVQTPVVVPVAAG